MGGGAPRNPRCFRLWATFPSKRISQTCNKLPFKMQPQVSLFLLNPLLPKIYTDSTVDSIGALESDLGLNLRLSLIRCPQESCVTSISCLSSSLSFLTHKIGLVVDISYINMCKLLFSIVGYVFYKVDSISDSSLPISSLEGKKDFSLKNPKWGLWSSLSLCEIIGTFCFWS